MSKITGVIQEVKKQQRGSWLMADIVVGGETYGAGPDKFFKGKAGQYVEFDLDEARGYKNVAKGSLKLGEFKGVPEPYTAVDNGPVKGGPVRNTSSFDNRQDAISRQAASNTAIAWITVLAAQGALPAVTSKTKGAQTEALDALREEYEKYFYEHNTGVAWKDISPNKKADGPAEDGEDTPEDAEWQ